MTADSIIYRKRYTTYPAIVRRDHTIYFPPHRQNVQERLAYDTFVALHACEMLTFEHYKQKLRQDDKGIIERTQSFNFVYFGSMLSE